MRKIVRIKEERFGGCIIALFDLDQRSFDSGESLVLPSAKSEVIARQLATIISKFDKNPLVIGIMEDLKALCVRHGVALNPKWRTFRVPQK